MTERTVLGATPAVIGNGLGIVMSRTVFRRGLQLLQYQPPEPDRLRQKIRLNKASDALLDRPCNSCRQEF
ncbi:MAG TPA: hypothetical protein VMU40_19465 [Steroidobacteraceae bacterium]|nr:hypothetical protein [Steroidobacteraceae bacterium]